jgi:hypothetical protein
MIPPGASQGRRRCGSLFAAIALGTRTVPLIARRVLRKRL